MTILALVLTLFTCREACGSWFSQHHCAELMQQTHNDQNASISANASYKKAFVYDNTKVTSERSPSMALEMAFKPQEKHFTPFQRYSVQLFETMMQQNSCVCSYDDLQMLIYSLCGSRCPQFNVKRLEAKHLLYLVCLNKCNQEVNIQSRILNLEPACSEYVLSVLSGFYTNLVYSKKALVRIFSAQILPMVCTTSLLNGLKAVCLSTTDSHRWNTMTPVLLFEIYITQLKVSSSNVHGRSFTMGLLLTFTFCIVSSVCFLGWPHVAVWISLLICLTCMSHFHYDVFLALIVTKLFCPNLQFFTVVLFLRLLLQYLFSKDLLFVVGLSLKFAVIYNILATLYCVVVLIVSFIKLFMPKLKLSNGLKCIHIVICVNNSRIATKYVLNIKIT